MENKLVSTAQQGNGLRLNSNQQF